MHGLFKFTANILTYCSPCDIITATGDNVAVQSRNRKHSPTHFIRKAVSCRGRESRRRFVSPFLTGFGINISAHRVSGITRCICALFVFDITVKYVCSNKVKLTYHIHGLIGGSTGTVTVKAIYTHGTYSQWTASCTVNVNYGWPLYNKPSINARTSWGARAYIESRLYEREQRIQNLHMDEENKCDIAYHFIIDPCGNIWEGALIDEYQRGHADGYFDDIGVLILGDFEPRLANLWNPDTLNTNQMNAAIDLAKWLCFEYDLPINTENDIIPIATHNNVNSGTVCPGENATQWIEVTLYNNIKQWYLNGAY